MLWYVWGKSDARNHHYVPQAYLRGLSRKIPQKKEHQVVVSDIARSKSVTSSTRNIAAKRDFNRINFENHHPNSIEEAYGKFEDLVRPAVSRTVKSRKFHGQDRTVILNLIALMATRSPRIRAQMNKAIARLSRSVVQLSMGNEDRYNETMKELLA